MPKQKSLLARLKPRYRFSRTATIAVAALIAVVGTTAIVITRASGPYFYMAPANASVYKNSTFDVQIWENSYTASVNAAEADFNFPESKLSYISVSHSGSNFNLAAPISTSNGLIKLPVGSTQALTGKQLIGTIRFKSLVGAGQKAPLNYLQSSAIISSSTVQNILSYTQGSTFSLLTPPTTPPAMTLTPTSAKFAYSPNANVAVSLWEQSGLNPINAFEGVIDYPVNLLHYDHVVYWQGFNQATFPNINNGKLTINAAIFGGQLTGPHKLATIYFGIEAAGTANLKVDPASVTLSAVTNTNVIVNRGSAKYTLTKP